MRRKNKNSTFFFIFCYCVLFNFSISIANDNINFLSLKNEEVNLRSGPSFSHPIKLIYNKKYLPVIILDISISDFLYKSIAISKSCFPSMVP